MISGKTPWHLYNIHMYVYQSCLPSHYFYITTKKTEHIRNSIVTSFFKPKKHMGEILKNNGEWVDRGWKPTNLFWNREKFPGIACRPACCPSDPFMDWSSSSGIESSDSILLSVKFNDDNNLSGEINYIFDLNKIHTHPNEWKYGWTFHGSMFFTTQKRKTVKILFVFLAKICDISFIDQLTVILPTLPPKKRLKQVSCKDTFLPPTVLP